MFMNKHALFNEILKRLPLGSLFCLMCIIKATMVLYLNN